MLKTVFFRADANSTIGLGHLTRSLALADMLTDFLHCTFLVQNPSTELVSQFNEKHSLICLPETTDYLAEAQQLSQQHLCADSIVVLDGYEFRTDYQRIIKESGCKLVCIDDLHAWHFVADIVINQAGGTYTEKYSHESYTQFFLGPAYALLRKPFLELATKERRNLGASSSNIMLAMGGADTDNHTLRILKVLDSSDSEGKIYIVTGIAYKHSGELKQFIQNNNSLNTELFENLNANEMAGVMSACSIAITPPSGIAYEYLCSGGTLYLEKTADNQRDVYDFLIKNKFALDFESAFGIVANPKFASMSSPIDGQSPKRLKAIFTSIAENIRVNLRKATVEDVDQYYEWVNETEVRKNSLDNRRIAYSDHVRWFADKLTSDSTLMYYFERGGKAIGQVRLDFRNGEIQIDYSLDRNFRGLGLGKIILTKAIERLIEKGEEWGKRKMVAIVKAENVTSCKVFKSLDFQQQAAVELNNETYHKFTK